MANIPAGNPAPSTALPRREGTSPTGRDQHRSAHPGIVRGLVLLLLIASVLIAPLLFAQGNPRVATADPATGKVDDTITLTGENLGKANVTDVFLSDDKNDFKAAVVDQANEKITMKVPKVKAGNYNVSLQVGGNIYIQPVHFKVQE